MKKPIFDGHEALKSDPRIYVNTITYIYKSKWIIKFTYEPIC